MSDHNERACAKCGSLTHHEDDCAPSAFKQAEGTIREDVDALFDLYDDDKIILAELAVRVSTLVDALTAERDRQHNQIENLLKPMRDQLAAERDALQQKVDLLTAENEALKKRLE